MPYPNYQPGYYPAQMGYYPQMYQQPAPVPIQQTQQPQQAPVVSQSTGALSFDVDNASQIRAVDVPMNLSYVLFPSKDGSSIYKKFWNGKGELESEVYVKQDPVSSNEPDLLTQISERLTRIEETLAAWSK